MASQEHDTRLGQLAKPSAFSNEQSNNTLWSAIMTVKVSKIHWHSIEKYGLPAPEHRKMDNGQERIFLVKTDCGLRASYLFSDGSGFSDLNDECALAWAIASGE
jgi:hypothetical protein